MSDKNVKEVIDFDDLKATWFDKVKWFFEDLRYLPNSFITGVKNLIKWFPIIWKDRDWDDHYIFQVLKFKLTEQAKYIGGKNRHLSAKRDAELMMTAVKLIDLVKDETYSMEYMDYHKTKHFFIETDKKMGEEKSYKWKSDELSERFDEYFAKYPRQYKRVMNGEINRFRGKPSEKSKQVIAMEIAHENHNRCRKLLFKLMEEHIEGWWD
jgi:hypothetical protein